jgi:hypothetical protein
MATEVRPLIAESPRVVWLMSTYRHAAGANLVGSDLYTKLSAYFIEHFKPLIAVNFSCIRVENACLLSLEFLCCRNPKHCKTSIS